MAMEKPNYKGADGLVEEVIQTANEFVPKTKQGAFWHKVSGKTDEMTAAIQKAREDAWELGRGEGYDAGYKHGYRDGHTDQVVQPGMEVEPDGD
jgi:flagellar biosynthesis/type III secretory pathway protein FliH